MTFGAMILAAGRGERMRPLTDTVPKPLLPVAGKPLIVRQIEALARAGFTEIVVNAAHLAHRLTDALGDGASLGVRLRWSIEPEPLETAGGIATALPLLPHGPALIVSGDICTTFDYASLRPRAAAMRDDPASPRLHLVMVPNPAYHPAGDFVLPERADGEAAPLSLPPASPGSAVLTFGNIGLYDTALFAELPRGAKIQLGPLFRQWIGAGLASGERYAGAWANVGTPDELARLSASLASSATGIAA